MQVPSSSRVLLAPDSALCRRVGGVLFRAGEFSCRTVLTGEGLDRVLAWWRPTAVVLWPGLPGSDGAGLLATIRHYSAELPVLVLTRGLDNGQLIAMSRAGAGTLIPDDELTQLPALLQQALEQQRLGNRQACRLRTLSATATALLVCDLLQPDWPVIDTNPALEVLTGWSGPEILGHSLALLTWDGDGRLQEALQHACRGGGEPATTLLGRHRVSGTDWAAAVQASVIRDADGTPRHGVLSLTDITRTYRQLARLEARSHFDALTGLPNRALFKDRLQQAIFLAERRGGVVAVVLIDLDNFKMVNTTFGHDVGEQVLRQVAGRLQGCIRQTDTLARLGGDEFVLLMNDSVNRRDTLTVLNRLLGAMHRGLEMGGRSVTLTASLGVSFYPDDGRDPEILLSNADTAMYRAKDVGRNNIQYYTAEMNSQVEERLLLDQGLRDALEQQSFFLVYQPQLTLDANQVTGVEALIRWRHPELGLVPPDRFISLAEENGLINAIGEWVLRQACRQVRAWQRAGLPALRVAVNLSARQFQGRELLRTVAGALVDSGLAAQYLELELTESILMRDLEETIVTLRGLKALGVQIAIDDFGTGYSSLSYLKRLPLDRLKIDRSFIGDLGDNADDAVIIQAIISLGHSLGLTVIAEGVETVEQLAFLRDQGCDEIQGYWLSPPLPADSAEQWLTRPLAEPLLLALRRSAPEGEDSLEGTVVLLTHRVQELEQAERSLAQEHGLLRALVDHLPDHVYAKDIHGRFIVANSHLVGFLGAESEEELIGKTDFDFYELRKAERYFDDEQSLLVSGRPMFSHEELAVDLHSGERRWLYCIKAPFYDARRQIVGLVGVNRDISERKQLLKRIETSLTYRERQLRIAGQIAQSVTDGLELEIIARRAVTLLCEESGLMYCEFFRVLAQELELVAGHGQLGSDLLRQGHREGWRDGIAGEAFTLGCPVHRQALSGNDARRLGGLGGSVAGHYAVPLRRNIQDGDAQARALRYFMDEAVAGMVVCVIDPDTVAGVCEEAMARGVRVVCQSEDLGESRRNAFIGVEEYRCGLLLGEQAGGWANAQLAVGETLRLGLFNYRLLPQVAERERGILDGLRRSFRDTVEVVACEASADPLTSIGIAEHWLSEIPDLRMILGINDASALGALRAVIARGRNDPSRFFIGGIDATDEALVALAANGAFQATVEYPARAVGRIAVAALAAAIAGRPYDRQCIIAPHAVNHDNLEVCLQTREEPPPPPIQEDWVAGLRGLRIGLSVMNLSNPFFQSLVEAARLEAQRFGMELLVSDPGPVLGVLSAFTGSPERPDREDRLGLEGVAHQLAVALELARWRQR